MNKKTLPVLALLMIISFSCSKDEEDDKSSAPEYIIVNNGGGVTSANDNSDGESLDIAQAVPSESGETYSKNIPILFFFNDKILLSSLVDNFEVTQNGKTIGGTITLNEGANGYAILTFTPKNKFSNNADIEITIDQALEDDGGNNLYSDFTISFETEEGSTSSFDSNKGFEDGVDGTFFMGDGAVLSGGTGCAAAQSGSNYAAITTGEAIVSSEYSIGSASSLMVLGPINKDLSSFSFYYNFISSEFNEYVDSEFDDSVIITIYGPEGAHSEFLTSVNTIGYANSACSNFTGMPDVGDSYAGHIGWQSKSLNFSGVGSPAFVVFTVTDVSDAAYSSVLTIDNTSF